MQSPIPQPENMLAQARDAANSRDFVRAEVLLNDVLTEEPMHLVALDLLGFVLFFQGRPAEAELACRRALAIEPHRAYSTKGLGLCLARQGRVDDGVECLREAIRLAPTWFDPRWDLAVVLIDARRWQAASDVLDDAELAVPAESARFAKLRAHLEQRRIASPQT